MTAIIVCSGVSLLVGFCFGGLYEAEKTLRERLDAKAMLMRKLEAIREQERRFGGEL